MRPERALDTAIAANLTLARDAAKGAQAAAHLAELRARAQVAEQQMQEAAAAAQLRRRSAGPTMCLHWWKGTMPLAVRC
jgi:hypothetical protein